MAESRFGQLSPGQKFQWKGKVWQKTSPILARPEGENIPVLVPRSTFVEPLDASPDAQPVDKTRQIMQQLQNNLLAFLETLPLSPGQREDLTNEVRLLVRQTTERLQENFED